jgi:hypothetical protein
MSTGTLFRLLYRSDANLATLAASADDLVEEIVQSSAARNRSDDLTGALSFHDGTFVQALEGPLSALEATFERICCDLRHRHLRLLEMSLARERAFSEWSMARAIPADSGSHDEVHRIDVSMSTSEVIRAMRETLLANATRVSQPS